MLLLAVGLVSCDTSNTNHEASTKAEPVKIAAVSNGEVTPQVNDAELKKLAADAYNSTVDKKKYPNRSLKMYRCKAVMVITI